MTDFKNIFPVLNESTYLNTPAIGLITKNVMEYRNNQYQYLYKKGSEMFEANGEVYPNVREKIGSFFHAEPGLVALFPAFSYGLNALLEGLEPKQKVLLLASDYPSINWAVKARDFEISEVEISENLEETIYQHFQTHTPDVFIFSMVQFLNGVKIDFEFVKKLKVEFPHTLLIGDGTQYLGTEHFDFKNSGFDVVGASGYKWLGAGFGNGFFMFKKGLEERIVPKYLGFGSVMGKYKSEGDTLIGKFEGNHLDPSNIGSLGVGIEWLESLGMDFIENKVRQLSTEAKRIFSENGLLETAVAQRSIHSNIFSLKGDEVLFQKLKRNGIACAQRGEGIRVGFHYYNSMADLERLMSVIRS